MKPSLVFSAGREPFEWLVRIGTLSAASHVAIGLGSDLLYVHERGVVMEARSKWLSNGRRLVDEYEIVPDVLDRLEVLKAQIGWAYDSVGASLIVLRRVLRHTKSKLPIATGRDAQRTSAAFIMQLDPLGTVIPEWSKIDRSIVAPADLLLSAQYGPSFEKTRR